MVHSVLVAFLILVAVSVCEARDTFADIGNSSHSVTSTEQIAQWKAGCTAYPNDQDACIAAVANIDNLFERAIRQTDLSRSISQRTKQPFNPESGEAMLVKAYTERVAFCEKYPLAVTGK